MYCNHRPNKTVFAAVALSIIFLSTTAIAQRRPGDLDPTFGSGGRVFTNIVSSEPYPWAESMLVQPDGKIIVAGPLWADGVSLFQGGYLVRYLPDGSLDPSFGQNGKVFTLIGGSALAMRPDGRILVAPRYQFSSSGVFDETFGRDGSSCGGDDIALQPDGKILGTIFESGVTGQIVVNRCNTDGSLDTTFGTVGEVRISDEPYGTNKVLVQPDGKILVVAAVGDSRDGGHILVARFNSNGIPDATFGSNGKVVLVSPDLYANAVATLLPNGKIVVVRVIIQGFSAFSSLVRFNPDGSIDSGFGANGIQPFPFFIPNAVLSTGDEKIVLGGNLSDQSGINSFGVARLLSNGGLDPTFGAGGKSLFPMNAGGRNYATAGPMAVQHDGKVLIVGTFYNYYTDSHEKIALLRVNGGFRSSFDFDGDGRADLAVRRPSDNIWYFLRTSAGFTGFEYGVPGDLTTPADFDGDGNTDVAVFRPSNGTWYIAGTSSGFYTESWGQAGDMPVPADYDGDGRADPAVFRPSTGTWYEKRSSSGLLLMQFGTAEDEPQVGDFDGDGKADLALRRPSDNTWYFLRSTAGFTGFTWGVTGDIAAPADFDGDGKTDVAVFRPSTGVWYVAGSATGFRTQAWGKQGDIPVPADYDGDGKADTAVFRPSSGTWYLNRSTAGMLVTQFGANGDLPIPNPYVPLR
jgi:uncharacterized delta-60 repeat protein